MLASSFVPYEMKTSYLKIWSCDEKVLKGTLTNSYYDSPLYFDNLMTLLLLMNELLDSLNYPQRAMEERRFGESSGVPLADSHRLSQPEPAKLLASFKLNVLFRQNASWQGNLVWIDKEGEAQFRSALELVCLIDEALTSL